MCRAHKDTSLRIKSSKEHDCNGCLYFECRDVSNLVVSIISYKDPQKIALMFFDFDWLNLSINALGRSFSQ